MESSFFKEKDQGFSSANKSFLSPPFIYKKKAINSPIFSNSFCEETSDNREMKQNNDLLTRIFKKTEFAKKKAVFSPIQSKKNEPNVSVEYAYFQEITRKIIEKKLKEFQDPNAELPDYYIKTLKDYLTTTNNKKMVVFFESLRKTCPFFDKMDAVILKRALLALGINPNNNYSVISWDSFKKISRLILHKSAISIEKEEFIVNFLLGKESFHTQNKDLYVSGIEFASLFDKLAESFENREEMDEIYEHPSIKDIFLRNLELCQAWDKALGLKIKEFKEALRRKQLEADHFMHIILGNYF